MAAALALVLWLQAQKPEAPAPGRIPPFAPGPLSAEPESGTARARAVPYPGVILYVDDTCRFCAEEMRRWHAATGDVAPAWLTVIRHPGDGEAHPGVVPSAWAASVVVDRTGAIAARLGVTAVPFLARTDSSGTVVEVTQGLTSPERILTFLETLGHRPGKGIRP